MFVITRIILSVCLYTMCNRNILAIIIIIITIIIIIISLVTGLFFLVILLNQQ